VARGALTVMRSRDSDVLHRPRDFVEPPPRRPDSSDRAPPRLP